MSMATGGQRNVEVCAPDIPTVDITLGDSAGISPEVLAKMTFPSILPDAAAWLCTTRARDRDGLRVAIARIAPTPLFVRTLWTGFRDNGSMGLSSRGR